MIDPDKIKERLAKLERWHVRIVRTARFLSPLLVIGTIYFAVDSLHSIESGERQPFLSLDVFALVMNVFAAALNLQSTYINWTTFDWNGNLRKGWKRHERK